MAWSSWVLWAAVLVSLKGSAVLVTNAEPCTIDAGTRASLLAIADVLLVIGVPGTVTPISLAVMVSESVSLRATSAMFCW